MIIVYYTQDYLFLASVYCFICRKDNTVLQQLDVFLSSGKRVGWHSAGLSSKSYSLSLDLSVIMLNIPSKCVIILSPEDVNRSSLRYDVLFSTYEGCSKSIWPLAGKNTFTHLEVCNSNPLRSSLLVTEHTSPSGSAIWSISGMPLCEWSTAWLSCSV